MWTDTKIVLEYKNDCYFLTRLSGSCWPLVFLFLFFYEDMAADINSYSWLSWTGTGNIPRIAWGKKVILTIFHLLVISDSSFVMGEMNRNSGSNTLD